MACYDVLESVRRETCQGARDVVARGLLRRWTENFHAARGYLTLGPVRWHIA